MVQFKVSRLLGLRVQVDGVAVVNEQGMQLTFNEPDQAERLWDADCETVMIPWEGLLHWKCDYGLLGDQLRLQVASPELFGSLPGVQNNEVELDVRKVHRDALKAFEKRAREYQSGQRTDNADEMLDDIRDFLYDLNGASDIEGRVEDE